MSAQWTMVDIFKDHLRHILGSICPAFHHTVYSWSSADKKNPSLKMADILSSYPI